MPCLTCAEHWREAFWTIRIFTDYGYIGHIHHAGMYRVTPLSLIGIHLVGFPADGALVIVPAPAPDPLFILTELPINSVALGDRVAITDGVVLVTEKGAVPVARVDCICLDAEFPSII